MTRKSIKNFKASKNLKKNYYSGETTPVAFPAPREAFEYHFKLLQFKTGFPLAIYKNFGKHSATKKLVSTFKMNRKIGGHTKEKKNLAGD